MNKITACEQSHRLCDGCLSNNRTLSQLSAELNKVYARYVQENVACRSPLLCWECVANIQKFIKFKKKCLQASTLLHKNTITSKTFPSLSTIKICKTNIKNITHIENVNTNEEYENKEVFNDNFIKNETAILKDVEIDLQVVKIEENCLKDVEECFVEDGFYMDEDDNTDTNCKNDINTISKNVTDKQTDDEFDGSDNEPLYNKRTVSLTEKKNKKSQGKVVSKGRGKRGEAPAGVVEHPRVKKKLQQLNVPDGMVEMVVLSWEQVEEERQKALKSEVYTRHRYRCESCVVGFNHRHKLDNHMKKHDPSSGEFICELCSVRFRDNHSLSAHRRRHRLRWRCVRCGGAWSRACVAADHVSRTHAHTRALPHTCGACLLQLPSLGKLRNHLKSHAERQKCDICGKTFRDKTSLKTHLFIHTGEKEYSCPRCDKKFLFKKAMEVHQVTHDEYKHLYCYECDVNFKNVMSYTQHMKYSLKHIHPDKLKYSCPLCDKKFRSSSRLREHDAAIHLKITPIQCTQPACSFIQDDAGDLSGMSQSTMSLLCKQVALAILAQRTQWIKMPQTDAEQNKVIVGFYSLCAFRQVIGAIDCTHIRIPKVGGQVGQYYINRKGYSSINVQSCSSRPVLRAHIRAVHRRASSRNHVCHYCGRTYTTKKSLEGHIRSHTGERPFKCGTCSSRFSYEAALYNHNRLVHSQAKKKSTQILQHTESTMET